MKVLGCQNDLVDFLQRGRGLQRSQKLDGLTGGQKLDGDDLEANQRQIITEQMITIGLTVNQKSLLASLDILILLGCSKTG